MKLIVMLPLLLMVGYLSTPFILQIKTLLTLHRFGYKGVFTLSRIIYQEGGRICELRIFRSCTEDTTNLNFQMYDEGGKYSVHGWCSNSFYFSDLVNAVLDFEKGDYMEKSIGLSLMERLPFMNSILRDELSKESTGTLFERDF